MNSRPQQLWIIDIDGTLVNVHANQVPAWLNMFQGVYGATMDEATLVSFFGKPFTSVLVDALGHVGIDEPSVMSKFDQAFAGYVQGVQQGLDTNGGNLLPGALDFLKALGEKNILRAIATGNPRQEAMHKLEYFNLVPYFEIMQFADDRRERAEIVMAVIDEARKRFGVDVHSRDVKIIGDSLHDVESAHRMGAFSIAVATGTTSFERLAAKNPDRVYRSLEDYETVIREATE